MLKITPLKESQSVCRYRNRDINCPKDKYFDFFCDLIHSQCVTHHRTQKIYLPNTKKKHIFIFPFENKVNYRLKIKNTAIASVYSLFGANLFN